MTTTSRPPLGRSAPSTSATATSYGRSRPFLARESSATTRGRRMRTCTPVARTRGGRSPLMRRGALCTSQPDRPPMISMEATARATICSATPCSRWMPAPENACGTSQAVHHDIWDYDLVAAPQLVTVRHDGQTIDAVATAGKNGLLFAFNRVTGEPALAHRGAARPSIGYARRMVVTDAASFQPHSCHSPGLIQSAQTRSTLT